MYGRISVAHEWTVYCGVEPAPNDVHWPADGRVPFADSKLCIPSPICLLEQLMRAAASRTFCTAGRSRPIRIAMIAMTTSSSIRVNADLRPG